MNLLAPKFPFDTAVGRQLHLALCRLYPTSKGALFAATSAGLDPAYINVDQPPIFVWFDILKLASPAGKLPELVEAAAQQFSEGADAPFLNSLLTNSAVRMSAEPLGANAKPQFVAGTDDVSMQEESLLFGNDLSVPVGEVESIIQALKAAQTVSSGVCKLEVTTATHESYGTGFRIGPQTVLTNWHVAFVLGEPATKIVATFGYELDAQGSPLQGVSMNAHVKPIAFDKQDDWAILKIDNIAPDYAILDIAHNVGPDPGDRAYIIQHPGGTRKRIAYARNAITHIDDRVLQYLTDTNTGASGAPVLNSQGLVVGLHHAGGRPHLTMGGEPVQKNEGICVARVAKTIAALSLQL